MATISPYATIACISTEQLPRNKQEPRGLGCSTNCLYAAPYCWPLASLELTIRCHFSQSTTLGGNTMTTTTKLTGCLARCS